MRSEMPITTSMSCSTTTIVTCPASRRTKAAVRRVSSGLMPAVGSSSRRKSGVGGDRDADLQIALLAVRQLAGRRVALRGEPELADDLLGPLVHRGERVRPAPEAVVGDARLGRDARVLEHREVAEDVGDLVR